MFASFFSMQNPSTYINIILIISILSYVIVFKRFEILKFFLYGCLFFFFNSNFFESKADTDR